jgi:predicted small lipoprotein YifL
VANRIKMKAICLTLMAVFILAACGQKIDLYMPEEPATNNTSPDSQPAIESAEKGKN